MGKFLCPDCPDLTFDNKWMLGAHNRHTHPGKKKPPTRPKPRERDAAPDPNPGYYVEVGSARVHCATAADAVELIGALKVGGL